MSKAQSSKPFAERLLEIRDNYVCLEEIIDITLSDDRTAALISEECDRYFGVECSKEELQSIINAMQGLCDKMPPSKHITVEC